MQPVNVNQLQKNVIPAQQRISGQRDPSPNSVKTSPGRDAFVLPDDVVSLSSDRSSIADFLVNKKPSVPVSPVERKALQDSFSVYA